MPFEHDLQLADPAYVALCDHCLSDLGRERVGLLVGAEHTVLHAVPLENLATGADSFHIRGTDIGAVKKKFAPLTVLGRYHTHPANQTTPSVEDRVTLPKGWLELIVCVALPDPCVSGSRPTIASVNAFDGRQKRHRVLIKEAVA